jgi:hypothetical protein
MVSSRRHGGRGRSKPEHRHRCQLTVIRDDRPDDTYSACMTEGIGQGGAQGGKGVLPARSLFPFLPGLTSEYGRAGTLYAHPATRAFIRDPGMHTSGHRRPPSTYSTTHSNYRMHGSAEHRVSRPAPPYAGEVGLPTGVGTGSGQPSPPGPHRTPMSTLRSSTIARKLSRHTRPAEVRPDMPGTGVEQSTGKRGKPVGGHLLDPVALVLRAGSELITDPLPSPFFPRVTGVGQAGPRQRRAPRLDHRNACFSAWSMLACLAG